MALPAALVAWNWTSISQPPPFTPTVVALVGGGDGLR